MKTLLLAILVATGLQVSAQCVPNQLYADSVYGVWPDTTQNFVSGMVNTFYSDTLTLLVPSQANLIDPALPSMIIVDSVQLSTVTGLPPGITVSCNSQTGGACTYLPNQVGCGLIQGTPTMAGTYPITLNVIAYATFLGVQALPQAFTGYSITIMPAAAGIGDIAVLTLDGVKNVPNPFTDRTTIEFNLAKAGMAHVKVFNLVGEQLWKTTVQGKPGSNRVPFTLNTLENGIYLYSVEAGGVNFTGRMMVNR
ncbi:MAG: T9SS type A sorting domain-containing protein [Flavobacteriales bacterium]